jgi:prevent-host-death family protein
MKKVPLSEIKDQLAHYLHQAEKEDVLITRHGIPAGILVGFGSEDDWFDYRLENDPRFFQRIEEARKSVRSGRAIPLDEVPDL